MTNSSSIEAADHPIDNNKAKIDDFLTVLDIASALIMCLGTESPAMGVLLVILSLPLLLRPSLIIPLLFLSSWSSSIAVVFVSAFFYYYFLFILSLLINRNSWRIRFGDYLCPASILAFAIWVAITGLTAISGMPYTSLKLCIYISIALLMSMISIRKLHLSNRAMQIISVLLAFFFLVRAIFFPVEFSSEESSLTDMTVVPGMGTNCIAQAIVILFLLIFCSSLQRKSLAGLGIASLYFFTLFFLGSRTSLYSSLILGFVFFLLEWKTHYMNKIYLAIACLVIILPLFSLGGYFENFQRLGLGTIAENQGSGRFLNWALYINDIIPNYPLTGIGTGIENFNQLGYIFDADNLYMDLICQTGFPGALLFFVCFFFIVRRIYYSNRQWSERGLVMTITLSFLLTGFGESVYESSMTWMCFGYAMLCVNSNPYGECKLKKLF